MGRHGANAMPFGRAGWLLRATTACAADAAVWEGVIKIDSCKPLQDKRFGLFGC